jgi:hypothetical protein
VDAVRLGPHAVEAVDPAGNKPMQPLAYNKIVTILRTTIDKMPLCFSTESVASNSITVIILILHRSSVPGVNLGHRLQQSVIFQA